jgi:hypothetical protein
MSVIKSKRLMQFRDAIGVCSKDHMKHAAWTKCRGFEFYCSWYMYSCHYTTVCKPGVYAEVFQAWWFYYKGKFAAS